MRGSTDRSHGLANSNVYLGRYQYSGSKDRCEALLAAADSGGCRGGPIRLGPRWPHKTVALRRELFTGVSRAGLCGLLDLRKAGSPGISAFAPEFVWTVCSARWLGDSWPCPYWGGA